MFLCVCVCVRLKGGGLFVCSSISCESQRREKQTDSGVSGASQSLSAELINRMRVRACVSLVCVCVCIAGGVTVPISRFDVLQNRREALL